ncbi:helix-turn-helix domain-containing protein [Thermodesulfobacteriota bacterium]
MTENTEKEILTVEDVSEYLQMGKRSIVKMAKTGNIPCRKIMNKYRFDKATLVEWLSSKD